MTAMGARLVGSIGARLVASIASIGARLVASIAEAVPCATDNPRDLFAAV